MIMVDSPSNSGQQINIGGSVGGSNLQFIAAQTAHGNINAAYTGSTEDPIIEAKRHLDSIRTAVASGNHSLDDSAQALNAVAVVERELGSEKPNQSKVKTAVARLQDLTLSLTGLAAAVTGLDGAILRLFSQH
jgi:hypothetical protein